MSNGAHATSSAAIRYRVLRELASRSQRSFLATRDQDRDLDRTTGNVFVINRFTRSRSTEDQSQAKALRSEHEEDDARSPAEIVTAEDMAILLRDARCLAKNWHPNIARVRHVDLVDDTLFIATELLDGITLADLIDLATAKRSDSSASSIGSSAGPVLSPPILARIFLDVLSGLSALHGLRDGMNTSLSMLHRELCPTNVVIGKDGVARIVNVFRPRPVTTPMWSLSSSNANTNGVAGGGVAHGEALRYASPETLAGECEQDARVDIYAVGVMMWEALMGRPLYADDSASRIAQRQREEDVPRPPGPLGEVAMRALAFDPALRFRSAQDAASGLRAFARTALATGSAVAQTIVDIAGERIRARRAELEPLLLRRTASGQQRAVQLPKPSETDPPTSGPQQKSAASEKDDRTSGIPEASTAPSPSKSGIPPLKRPIGPVPFPVPQVRRIARPSDPDVETSYAPRPLPARLPTGSLTAATPLPAVRPSAPVPRGEYAYEDDGDDDDDNDLPGPRASTPDVEYVETLARFASFTSATTRAEETQEIEELDASDILDAPATRHSRANQRNSASDDANAIAASREVVVSAKSVTPTPLAPSLPLPTELLPTGLDEKARPPSFPELNGLTSTLASTPPTFPKSAPLLEPSLDRKQQAKREEAARFEASPQVMIASSATPTPELLSPQSSSSSSTSPWLFVARVNERVADLRRLAPNRADRERVMAIGAIALAAFLLLLAGAALISRRSSRTPPTTTTTTTSPHDPGPSTVIVPPPPPIDPASTSNASGRNTPR